MRSLCIVTCLLAAIMTAHAGGLKVVGLRCDRLTDPLGVDSAHPQLSWRAEAGQGVRDKKQSAYQILAAASKQALNAESDLLWDSGKQAMSSSPMVEYLGDGFAPGARVYWKVRVWDEADVASPWSDVSTWEFGLLDRSNWKASWIQRPPAYDHADDEAHFAPRQSPIFRKEFALAKKIASARAYVTGLGYYEFSINGERIGDHRLDPAWTDYRKRVFYSVYDVTDAVQRGDNAIGIMLGNGWMNPLPLKMWGHIEIRDALYTGEPRCIAQVVVTYDDGTSETIVTDPSWKWHDGPVGLNSVYTGEIELGPARVPGWDKPGLDDAAWNAVQIADAPPGKLIAQAMQPILQTRELVAKTITEPTPGAFIIDFGENITGVASLRVNGAANTTVSLRYGELLNADGTLNAMTTVAGQIKNKPVEAGSNKPSTAWQKDQYVLRGEGTETFTPRLTFHGFRSVGVTGLSERPTKKTLRALVMHSDVPSAGEFACSNELFNQIQEITRRTFLNNIVGVQSDCPHREKFGYGGDIVASSEAFLLNFDMNAFYAKAVDDLADAQRPNGGFTETAPFVGISDEGLGDKAGPIGWGTAHPLLLWQLSQYYGENKFIADHYPEIAPWIALLTANAKDGILDNGISDHESLVEKPRPLTGTAFYAFNADLASRLAVRIGNSDDASRYSDLSKSVEAAFNKTFLNTDTGAYFTGTQACQAFALYFDYAPADMREKVIDTLVQDIQSAHSGHLTTGIFGTKYMLDALSRYGRHDVAAEMVNKRDFPGWGHMIENGATTLWEHWEFSDNTFSHNHPMFGSVSEWMIKHVAGIRPADDAMGFNRIVIAPQTSGAGITWAKAHYDSVRGRVACDWKKQDDGTLRVVVEIPVDATATVILPAAQNAAIAESGNVLESTDPRIVARNTKSVQLKVGSGTYTFTVR